MPTIFCLCFVRGGGLRGGGGVIAVCFPGRGSLALKFGSRSPNGYRPPSTVITPDAHLLRTQTDADEVLGAGIYDTSLTRSF